MSFSLYDCPKLEMDGGVGMSEKQPEKLLPALITCLVDSKNEDRTPSSFSYPSLLSFDEGQVKIILQMEPL